jgi:hypothetical protein
MPSNSPLGSVVQNWVRKKTLGWLQWAHYLVMASAVAIIVVLPIKLGGPESGQKWENRIYGRVRVIPGYRPHHFGLRTE